MLIKIIDSNDWLSIQVHPDDELARKRNIGNGKTEMWYMLDADPDAELISGFSQDVEVDTYLEHLKNNSIKDLLNVVHVDKGDVFYIPAGRVHALGPGCLLAEIQQTSDTTYRIYDWDRIDAAGMKRELHTEDALDAIDFNKTVDYKTPYKEEANKTTQLVKSPFFITRFINADKPVLKNISELDSFVIYMAVKGNFTLKYDGGEIGMKLGETLLVPASMRNVVIHPEEKSEILEIFIDATMI